MERKLVGLEGEFSIPDDFFETSQEILDMFYGVSFVDFTEEHLPLYFKWAKEEHLWKGYFDSEIEEVNKIYEKFKNPKNIFPYIFEHNDKPIGFIQYYPISGDLLLQDIYKGLPKDTFGIDLFIGEKDYLRKGYGVIAVNSFLDKLLFMGITKIVVDPFPDNQQAIACYEKCGFKFLKQGIDYKNRIVNLMIRK